MLKVVPGGLCDVRDQNEFGQNFTMLLKSSDPRPASTNSSKNMSVVSVNQMIYSQQ